MHAAPRESFLSHVSGSEFKSRMPRSSAEVAVWKYVWKSLEEMWRAPIKNLMTLEANHNQMDWNGRVKAETWVSVVEKE